MKKQAVELTPEIGASEGFLSEKAYQSLVAMLLSGELAPNEVVMERQLALRLGISRTPLREAVRRLEGERLFERQRGGALVVRPLPLEEFIQILSVRRLLEGEAARLACGRIPQEELETLRTRIADHLDSRTDPSGAVARDSNRDLHALISFWSGNPVLQRMIEDLRVRTAMFRFERLPIRRDAVYDEHLALIDALISGDGERARSAMHHHIDMVRSAHLERLGVQ